MSKINLPPIRTDTAIARLRRTSTHVQSPVRQISNPNPTAWTKSMSITQATNLEIKNTSSIKKRVTISTPLETKPDSFVDLDDSQQVNEGVKLRRHESKPMDREFQARLKKNSLPISASLLPAMAVEMFYLIVLLVVALYENKQTLSASLILCLSPIVLGGFALVAKLIRTKWANNALSLYIFVCIYITILIFASNTESQMLLVLGLVLLFSDFLQSGHTRLTLHMVCIFAIVATVFLLKSLVINTDCLSLGVCPTYQASDLKFGLFWVSICLCMLLAFSYLDNQTHLNHNNFKAQQAEQLALLEANLDLQHQLRVAKIKPETDIAAPLTRATQLLVKFNESITHDIPLSDQVSKILGILNSDRLFEPEFFQDTGDTDVTNFLRDVLQNRKTTTLSRVFTNPAKAHQKQNSKRNAASKLMVLMDTIEDPFFDVLNLEVICEGNLI